VKKTTTNMASIKKRKRVQDDADTSLDSVWRLRVANATHTLCTSNQKLSDAVNLSPHRIVRSNAARGVTFAKAFCETRGYDVEFLFGDVFQCGIELITDYLHQGTLPADSTYRSLLLKLLDFFIHGKCQFTLNLHIHNDRLLVVVVHWS
jgi:hypothetical protein